MLPETVIEPEVFVPKSKIAKPADTDTPEPLELVPQDMLESNGF